MPSPKTEASSLVKKLDAAIEDFNKKSDALFDAEIKLAETYQELTLPLKEPFRRIQKHTEFRSSLYSLFADEQDYEILQYEKLVENSNDKF